MRAVKTRGFTLLESLITLLLLSIGLLGACALLLDGLQVHGDAMRQASAARLVSEMAERIRANPRARDLYETSGLTASGDCDEVAPCDPAGRAAADVAWFRAAARRLFPGPDTTAIIEFEPAIGPAAPDRYFLSLRWRGPRDAASILDAVTIDLLAPPVAG